MDLGRQYVEKHMPGVTTTAFELIPETAEVERVMERLIASGHKIIFATSYGYLDYAIKVGEKHPDVTILHAGGLKTSKNVGTYWADSDAGMYLAGVTAAHVSKSGKLGFQGGFQIPQLMRSVNAFTLGAQSVNPKITTTVVWNGGWWEPQKETEATNAFADLGIDVIAEQVDSPITIAQAAEKRGIFMIGKDVDIHDRAPKALLTGVSWDWGPMMVEEIKEIKAGTWKAVEHARRPCQRQRRARSVRRRRARGRAARKSSSSRPPSSPARNRSGKARLPNRMEPSSCRPARSCRCSRSRPWTIWSRALPARPSSAITPRAPRQRRPAMNVTAKPTKPVEMGASPGQSWLVTPERSI